LNILLVRQSDSVCGMPFPLAIRVRLELWARR
jgi:hypothetical protein